MVAGDKHTFSATFIKSRVLPFRRLTVFLNSSIVRGQQRIQHTAHRRRVDRGSESWYLEHILAVNYSHFAPISCFSDPRDIVMLKTYESPRFRISTSILYIPGELFLLFSEVCLKWSLLRLNFILSSPTPTYGSLSLDKYSILAAAATRHGSTPSLWL